MKQHKLLVICEGNICRSPMAEALLRSLCPSFRVSSAGLGALVGNGADPISVELMYARGIDISAHRARQITSPMTADADLILTMNDRQKNEVLTRYSFARGRVFSLGDRSKVDVIDPYRGDRDIFVRSLNEIDAGINAWLPYLLKF